MIATISGWPYRIFSPHSALVAIKKKKRLNLFHLLRSLLIFLSLLSRSKVQQVKETFEHLRQVSANEPLYGRVSQSQSTSSRCSSPSNRQGTSPFPSNKLSMYQGPQESVPGAQNQSTSQHHHSQFSIYATKNEVLTYALHIYSFLTKSINNLVKQ